MSTDSSGYENNFVVSNYIKYRPTVPIEIYDKILSYLDNGTQANGNRELVVDVGCGSGLSTLPLCKHFKSVIGIDPSEAQLDEAKKFCSSEKNVVFELGLAEHLSSTFAQESVDLVTAGTSLHWFDLELFYNECHHILKYGGILSAFVIPGPLWTNEQAHDVIHKQILLGILWPYFQAGVRHVLDNYEEAFSIMKQHFGDAEKDDSFRVHYDFSIEDVFGYIKSFPQYSYYKEDHPEHPDEVDTALEKLPTIFGTNSTKEKVVKATSFVSLIMGRKQQSVDLPSI